MLSEAPYLFSDGSRLSGPLCPLSPHGGSLGNSRLVGIDAIIPAACVPQGLLSLKVFLSMLLCSDEQSS